MSQRSSRSLRKCFSDLKADRHYYTGVFLYSGWEGRVPIVSNLQAYLDLYAGGRDLKQADYLLSNAIEPGWRAV